MTHHPETEVERIRREYRLRDEQAAAAGAAAPDLAHLFYVHSLEWEVVRILREGSVDLVTADVLDVGCGSGALSQRISELGARSVTGVDLMESRVSSARSRYPTLRFEQANAADLQFADASFDLVTHFACLSSVLDPDLRHAIAAEMWRVARPGGAVLSYDLRPSLWPVGLAGRAARRLRQRRAPAGARETPIRAIGADELRALFPQADLLHHTAILNVALGGVARRSRGLASLLAGVPPLRSHVVALARKPHAS